MTKAKYNIEPMQQNLWQLLPHYLVTANQHRTKSNCIFLSNNNETFHYS